MYHFYLMVDETWIYMLSFKPSSGVELSAKAYRAITQNLWTTKSKTFIFCRPSKHSDLFSLTKYINPIWYVSCYLPKNQIERISTLPSLLPLHKQCLKFNMQFSVMYVGNWGFKQYAYGKCYSFICVTL